MRLHHQQQPEYTSHLHVKYYFNDVKYVTLFGYFIYSLDSAAISVALAASVYRPNIVSQC